MQFPQAGLVHCTVPMDVKKKAPLTALLLAALLAAPAPLMELAHGACPPFWNPAGLRHESC